MSYDMIDRFLRNNLDDDDYAKYSDALNALCTPQRTPQERRDAGEWHCPECFTFGHQHRRGCTATHGIKENT
jgi:hypothetical protein